MHHVNSAGRWLAGFVLGILLALAGGRAIAATCVPVDWPVWSDFKTHFLKPDGRVVDASTPQLHSSSEGQSYAMFFALVANDPATFDKLWRWSVNNLAEGDAGVEEGDKAFDKEDFSAISTAAPGLVSFDR